MRLYLFALLVLLVACGDAALETDPATETPTAAPTGTAVAVVQTASAPTDEATSAVLTDLVIWWPDTLLPEDADVLNAQVVAFIEEEASGVDVEFRQKRPNEVGGILATLRSASAVAPGALPDITLMRRQDLIAARNANLVYPIEGLIPNIILDDMYDSGLALGQFDGQIYGLPYTLEIQLLAYRPPEDDGLRDVWTFDDIIQDVESLTFPAEPVESTLNPTLYLQYLAAGGTFPAPGELDVMTPERIDALRTVFTFYEQAHQAGIIDESVLAYNDPQDYRADFISGEYSFAVADSSFYLDLLADDVDLRAATLPTVDGSIVSTIDGWMWVVTTGNAERQAIALDFLAWMMEPSRQRVFAEALDVLPSQQSVLRSSLESLDIQLTDDIIDNAMLPMTEGTGGAFARAMQTALGSIISGESTAEETVEVIVEQFTD